MRILSLLLLCFSLAFANVSYAHSLNLDCPMEKGTSMGTIDHATLSGCCNDAATAAKTGDACKANQVCSTPNLIIFPSIPSLDFVSTDMSLTLRSIPFVLSLAPTTPWRPPTLS